MQMRRFQPVESVQYSCRINRRLKGQGSTEQNLQISLHIG